MIVARRIRRWRQSWRYRSTVRQLRALARPELDALGIPPGEIDRLACLASRS